VAETPATAAALASIAAEFGCKVGEAGGTRADAGIVIHARPGDVLHPRLRQVLAEVPPQFVAVAWDTLLIEAAPGLPGVTAEFRPPIPARELLVTPSAFAFALSPAAATLPPLAARAALVLPELLGARYGVAERPPQVNEALPATPASSATVVVAGGTAAALEATLQNLAKQTTAPPFTVVVVESAEDPAASKLPGSLQGRVVRVAQHLRVAERWVAGAEDAELLVLLEAGLTFADPAGLQRLLNWASLDQIGLVAAPVLEQRGRLGLVPQPGVRIAGQAASLSEPPSKLATAVPHVVPYEELRCWAISRAARKAARLALTDLALGDVAVGMRTTRAGRMNLAVAGSVVVLGSHIARTARPETVLAALYPDAVGLDLMRSVVAGAGELESQGGRVRLRPAGAVDGGVDAAAEAMLDWQVQVRNQRRTLLQVLTDTAGLVQKIEKTVSQALLQADDL